MENCKSLTATHLHHYTGALLHCYIVTFPYLTSNLKSNIWNLMSEIWNPQSNVLTETLNNSNTLPHQRPFVPLVKTFVPFVVKKSLLNKSYSKFKTKQNYTSTTFHLSNFTTQQHYIFTPQQLYTFTPQQLYNPTTLRLSNHLQDLAVLKPTSH